MTKVEYTRCEKLMEEAIRNAENAKEEFDKAESMDNIVEKCMKLAFAQNHQGYAERIAQTLACIGFKHERMEVLTELL
jgi:hypothetical protein